MAQGEPQLEQAEAVNVPMAAEPVAVPLEPATAPPVAVPYGARGPEGVGGMRDVLALSTPTERRRFVLQLQRTAGNAAVCRWLGAVRERYAARHARGDGPPEGSDGAFDLDALIGGADEPPNDEDGPRRR
jgi:hypothetical protein